MPKWKIQAEESASAHVAAVVVDSGTATVHRVVLSNTGENVCHPCQGGRGSTRSIWMWEKRRSGTGMTDGGGEM